MKTIHYLSGLPRSGNTLLSALLNQNPKIYSSPISPLNQLLYTIETECASNEAFIRSPNLIGINNVLKNVLQNYYSDKKQNIIFDREKCWTTPNNLNRILTFLDSNPKILFTVRNTLDILKSFVLQSNNHSFLENQIKEKDYLPGNYLLKNDAICDYIMQSEIIMLKPLLGLYNALKLENKKYVHFINYDTLIASPNETMKKMYTFLELDYFDHDFNNITTLEVNDEITLNLPQTLHKVYPTLKHYSPPIEEVLSPYIIEKYKNVDLWKNLI